MKRIGKGAFATAYVTIEEPQRVFVFVADDVYDKDVLELAKEQEPGNPHLPQVERFGETRDQTIYTMPLYRAPLRKADDPDGWKDYQSLKTCRALMYGQKSGYSSNEGVIACAQDLGVRPSVIDAVRALADAAANWSDEYVFEFTPRNLATDSEGRMVLLDPLFDRRALQRVREQVYRRREQADRRRRGFRW